MVNIVTLESFNMKKRILIWFIILFCGIVLASCDSQADTPPVPEECPEEERGEKGLVLPESGHGPWQASLIVDLLEGYEHEEFKAFKRECLLWRADYDGDGVVEEEDAQKYFNWLFDGNPKG